MSSSEGRSYCLHQSVQLGNLFRLVGEVTASTRLTTILKKKNRNLHAYMFIQTGDKLKAIKKQQPQNNIQSVKGLSSTRRLEA